MVVVADEYLLAAYADILRLSVLVGAGVSVQQTQLGALQLTDGRVAGLLFRDELGIEETVGKAGRQLVAILNDSLSQLHIELGIRGGLVGVEEAYPCDTQAGIGEHSAQEDVVVSEEQLPDDDRAYDYRHLPEQERCVEQECPPFVAAHHTLGEGKGVLGGDVGVLRKDEGYHIIFKGLVKSPDDSQEPKPPQNVHKDDSLEGLEAALLEDEAHPSYRGAVVAAVLKEEPSLAYQQRIGDEYRREHREQRGRAGNKDIPGGHIREEGKYPREYLKMGGIFLGDHIEGVRELLLVSARFFADKGGHRSLLARDKADGVVHDSPVGAFVSRMEEGQFLGVEGVFAVFVICFFPVLNSSDVPDIEHIVRFGSGKALLLHSLHHFTLGGGIDLQVGDVLHIVAGYELRRAAVGSRYKDHNETYGKAGHEIVPETLHRCLLYSPDAPVLFHNNLFYKRKYSIIIAHISKKVKKSSSFSKKQMPSVLDKPTFAVI